MALMQKQTLSWLLAGLTAVAAPTAMAATDLMVLEDTVTTLKLDLLWDADTNVAAFYGVHWNASFVPSFDSGQWSMAVWYAHKDGPHGEGMEHPGHVLPLTWLMLVGGLVAVGASARRRR